MLCLLFMCQFMELRCRHVYSQSPQRMGFSLVCSMACTLRCFSSRNTCQTTKLTQSLQEFAVWAFNENITTQTLWMPGRRRLPCHSWGIHSCTWRRVSGPRGAPPGDRAAGTGCWSCSCTTRRGSGSGGRPAPRAACGSAPWGRRGRPAYCGTHRAGTGTPPVYLRR